MATTLELDETGGGLGGWAAATIEAFDEARRVASLRIPLDDVVVTVRSDPRAAIPEWGVGGYTEDPHHVSVAVDPSMAAEAAVVVRTLLHEFHHAVRWRSTTLDRDLRDMLASEGLAVLFEVEVLGTEPFFVAAEPAGRDVAMALRALDERPCNASEWFYGAGRVPPAFGYSLGYRLCKEYALRSNRSAAELVSIPSSDIVGD